MPAEDSEGGARGGLGASPASRGHDDNERLDQIGLFKYPFIAAWPTFRTRSLERQYIRGRGDRNKAISPRSRPS